LIHYTLLFLVEPVKGWEEKGIVVGGFTNMLESVAGRRQGLITFPVVRDYQVEGLVFKKTLIQSIILYPGS
jgi:hypothetical protein